MITGILKHIKSSLTLPGKCEPALLGGSAPQLEPQALHLQQPCRGPETGAELRAVLLPGVQSAASWGSKMIHQ